MNKLKFKSALLALSLGLGLAGSTVAAPNAETCANLEEACEENASSCSLYHRYCL